MIGNYEITAVPGAGGVGDVFRPRDTRLNRDAAVKVLPKEFVMTTSGLRAAREANNWLMSMRRVSRR
jgi:serine/threonine protein kinase